MDPRFESRIEWRDATRDEAGVAERAGFKVRPKFGWNVWQVWATARDFADLKTQLAGTR